MNPTGSQKTTEMHFKVNLGKGVALCVPAVEIWPAALDTLWIRGHNMLH